MMTAFDNPLYSGKNRSCQFEHRPLSRAAGDKGGRHGGSEIIITRMKRTEHGSRQGRIIGQAFKALEDGTFDRPVWPCIYALKAELRSRNLAHRLIRQSSAFRCNRSVGTCLCSLERG